MRWWIRQAREALAEEYVTRLRAQRRQLRARVAELETQGEITGRQVTQMAERCTRAEREAAALRAQVGGLLAERAGEWPTQTPGEVERLRRQLHLSEAGRRGLTDRCERLQAANEAAYAELAPGWHPAAERRAKNLLRRTRMASDMPPAPVREPGLVEEVTAP